MKPEIVDADSHIMEPPHLWEENLEPRYRGRAMRLKKDEEGAVKTIEELGADRFLWGADYPHSDGLLNAVEALKGNLLSLPKKSQRKILGENAVKLYNLS